MGAASTVISLATMLFSGFLFTRITKKIHLPNVTAYIISGIIIGPYCLNLIPTGIISSMDFLPDIALSFISFSTGEFFVFDLIKKNGLKVVMITVFESLFASLFVFILTYYFFHLSFSFCMVLSALASATAPASTMMTIRQTGSKGEFVNTLLQVVALDDVVGLVLYSVAISVASAQINGISFSIWAVLKPIFVNMAVLSLGGIFGFILKLMLQNRSKDNKLIITLAVLFAFCGICTLLDISPLLGCMSMGTVYINLTSDSKLFKAMNYFSPPILLLFFVRSGLNFRLDSLFISNVIIGTVPLLLVGVFYFLVRILGKYIGAFTGCLLAKKDKKIRNNLGLALIPQAGVAIGLASLGARTLGGELGLSLETIILSSSVLYELIGPACAKLSLYLSGSYSNKIEDVVPISYEESKKSDLDLLIDRIHTIQDSISEDKNYIDESEEAFMEDAESLLQNLYAQSFNDRRFIWRRNRR